MQYVAVSRLIPVILLFWLTVPIVVHCNDYRLPESIKPEHYTIQILTYLDDIFEFNGNVLIKLKCFKSTDSVTLHSADLEIDEENVVLSESNQDEKSKDSIKILKHSYDTENEFYTIKIDTLLKENYNYNLYIPFKGNLTEALAGYYRSSYEDQKTGEKKWLTVTQFESISARRAFPCFDEPGMKAVFKISLGHDKKYVSISNMPIEKIETVNDTFVIDHYQDTVKMSTYLVAFVVCDFDYKYGIQDKKDKNSTEFRVWARKDAIGQVDFAALVGPKYLKYYEDFFNIKFPLPKQDMIAIPDFSAGAMENWGLITYRETALLYDPNVSSTTSKHRVASVIAHELAHQWFGNLVTMKWWTDLWLNEGFATYMAAKAVHHINPEWNSLNEENVENMLSVYTLDAMVSSHPVSVPIGNPNEIGQIFDTISYSKGSYILRMMNLFLGEDVFRNGLTNYLNKYKYSNAEKDDLWQSLTEEAHKQETLAPNVTVKQIMDTWTIQTGYPLVTVTRDYENKVGIITQQRFIKSLISQRANKNDSCWWIPLSYTTSKENNFIDTKPKAWFECGTVASKKATVIDLPGIDEWVLFNIQSAGLYKVNYDIQNWELLINALYEHGKDINVLNRVQLIDDAMDLAASGNLDYSIALKLLIYLVSETEYLAWNAALDHLSYINTMLKRTPSYGLFETYIRKIITPIYEKVAYEPAEKSADAVKRQVLVSTWACRFNVGDCQEQSSELFRQWMKTNKPDSNNPIPKDLRGVVYCTALRVGNEKEWEFLWQRYLKSNVGSEKNTILACLGCTEKMWLLSRYLSWTLDSTSGIRKQDIVSVFNSVASNNIGYFLAKDFLKSRIADINIYLGPKQDRLTRYLKAISRQMISESELEELQEFTKRKTRFLKHASLGVEQAIEKVTLNIDWHDKYYDKVSKLLEEYGKS